MFYQDELAVKAGKAQPMTEMLSPICYSSFHNKNMHKQQKQSLPQILSGYKNHTAYLQGKEGIRRRGLV